MLRSSRWPLSGALVLLPFLTLFAQVTDFKYDSGHTYREVTPSTDGCASPMCTYHKMQIWGNSAPIKEYTYRGTNAAGNVLEFMNWRMLFPVGYNKSRAQKYPMIVMLHGAGESGRLWTGNFNYPQTDVKYDNNDANISNGGKEHQVAAGWSYQTGFPSGPVTFPGIVIWPQVSYNGGWEGGWADGVLSDNNRMVAQIVEWVINHYNIDPDRIAIHGLSNGAKGVLDLAAKRPDLFSSVLPMSGIGSNDDVETDVLVTTPIWQFQGGKDINPTPQASQEMIDLFVKKGGNPLYTIYPTLAHNVWAKAYTETNFFPFILAANKKNIYVFGDDANVCPDGALKLGVSAGFASYQWAKNGTDIPMATERYYYATVPGTYTVKIKRQPTVAGGETITSNPVTVGTKPTCPVITAVQDEPGSLSVYPNPFSDQITVTLPEKIQGGTAVLISPIGQNVQSIAIAPQDSYDVVLDFSGIEAGAYVLNIGSYRFKVVKVN